MSWIHVDSPWLHLRALASTRRWRVYFLVILSCITSVDIYRQQGLHRYNRYNSFSYFLFWKTFAFVSLKIKWKCSREGAFFPYLIHMQIIFKTLDPNRFYQLLIGNDWCVVIFSARKINTTSCHRLLIFSVFTFSYIRQSTSDNGKLSLLQRIISRSI